MEQVFSPVFVFDRDGFIHLFKSVESAAGWVEAMDVSLGEYEAFIGLDGTRLSPVISDAQSGEVRLEPTGEVDIDDLRGRLHVFARSRGYDGEPEDPRAIANQVLANEWKDLWPRWWPWLHRRLHGAHPPTV